MRIDIRRVETLKVGTEMVGSHTKAKVVKNKIAPPFKTAEFDIMYGKGISKTGEIVDLAVQFDIIQKSGAWFSYGEMRIGQGRENAKQFLEDHPEICDEVEAKVREAFKAATATPQRKSAAPAAEPIAPAVQEKAAANVNIDISVD